MGLKKNKGGEVMRALKLLLSVVLLALSFIANAKTYGLYRKVEYLPEETNLAPFEWKVFLEDQVKLTSDVYGVFTPYGYKVRAEGIWLKPSGIYGDYLHCDLTLEKNEFPMDNQWDVIWSESNVIFAPGQVYYHQGEIAGRRYRMLLKFIVQEE